MTLKHNHFQRFLAIAFLALSYLLFGSPFRASAQENIVIQENQVVQNFPNNISFQLKATTPVAIKSVTLRYGTYGRSCQSNGATQPIEIDAGTTTIDASWKWDWSRLGVLPQGTEFWWEWQILDEGGQTFTTDRQTAIVTDERFTFQRLQADNVTVLWIEGSTAFGQKLLDTTNLSLTRLQEAMGIQLNEPLTLVVYPSAEDVRDAVIHVPEWTGGVAFPRYNSVVVGIYPGENEWLATVIPHELTHLVVGALVFNCIGIGVPTWLNEGLAEYGETGTAGQLEPGMLSALAAGNVPALRSLAAGFSAYGNDASLAYVQGKMVVGFLVSEYGTDKLLELLLAMKAGKRVDDALETVYGFDTDGLDSLWRQSLGYAPLPTRQPTPDASQATAVPTLAMFVPNLPASATPTIASSPSALPPTTTPQLVNAATPLPTLAGVDTAMPTQSNLESNNKNAPPYIWIGAGIVLVALAFVFFIYQRQPR